MDTTLTEFQFYRSEAFAEDVLDLVAPAPALQPPHAQGPRLSPAVAAALAWVASARRVLPRPG